MHGESQDKVALVTGAGSPTGIGFACARVLAREGASVAVASTTDRIHERAATLHGDGADAAGFIADLTDRSQARRMVAEVQQLFGRIDIVVNNAGMVNVGMDGENFLDFIDMNDADWDLDIAMNLHTAYNVTKPVVPGMIERGWGRIVMVSSVTGPFVDEPRLHGLRRRQGRHGRSDAGPRPRTRAARDHGELGRAGVDRQRLPGPRRSRRRTLHPDRALGNA